jgi:hypothetical protein
MSDNQEKDLKAFFLCLGTLAIVKISKHINDNELEQLKKSPYYTIRDMAHNSFKKDDIVIFSGMVKTQSPSDEFIPGIIWERNKDGEYEGQAKGVDVFDNSNDIKLGTFYSGARSSLNVHSLNQINFRRGVEKFNYPAWFLFNMFMPKYIYNGDMVSFQVKFLSENRYMTKDLTLGTKQVLIDEYKNYSILASHFSKFLKIFASLFLLKYIIRFFTLKLIPAKKDKQLKNVTCSICKKYLVNVVSLDCKHFTYCLSCCENLDYSISNCPICNSSINKYLLISN